jgi:hypothetical protein
MGSPSGVLPVMAASDAGLGDEVADAEFFPLGVAGAQALVAERLLLVGGHLVVGDDDGAAATAVLLVEAHHSVQRGSRAAEEVDDGGVLFVGDEKAKGVLDCVE